MGGGAFIATTGSYVHSTWPAPGNTWRAKIYDTVGGQGGMQVYASCRALGGITIARKSVEVEAGSAVSRDREVPGREARDQRWREAQRPDRPGTPRRELPP